MSRSSWKGFFVKKSLLTLNAKKKKIRHKKIWSRNSVIPFSLVGRQVAIHNGKEFIRIRITTEKAGYKFGEFSFTRRHRVKQKGKKGKNEKSKKKKKNN